MIANEHVTVGSGLLTGKRLLITGVATEDSIALATARRAGAMGAEVVLTAFPRDVESVRQLVRDTGATFEVFPLDLTERFEVDELTERLRSRFGHFDGALHAVAFAPRDALDGPFMDADPEGIELAFRTSAWSLSNLARLVVALAPAGGASLVGLDFDANGGAWPVYNWMGVCKAALGSTARYLARDLGPRGIRVNLVAAGPLLTRAARGIPRFDALLDAWATTSPLTWSDRDPDPVADAICFLLSDLARVVTGEILHADGGYHAMASPRPPVSPSL
jgi:enoyl-[acyl-carrier protein] reductase I